jgi:tetratricopeptide (TPR) repeat protein
MLRRTEEAHAEIWRALELDPLSPIINRMAGQFALYSGDYDEAIERARRAVELSPSWDIARMTLAHVYAQAGMEQESLEALLGLTLPSSAKMLLREAFESDGVRGAVKVLLELEQQRTGQTCPFGAAAMYAYVGDADGVFRCLEEDLIVGDAGPWHVDPVFEPYRSDPRNIAILRKMGLEE